MENSGGQLQQTDQNKRDRAKWNEPRPNNAGEKTWDVASFAHMVRIVGCHFACGWCLRVEGSITEHHNCSTRSDFPGMAVTHTSLAH